VISRSIGAPFAPTVAERQGRQVAGATLKVARSKTLLIELKQRALVKYQNEIQELPFGAWLARAKKGTVLSSFADNHGKLFAISAASYN
jgi:hypothetical protein